MERIQLYWSREEWKAYEQRQDKRINIEERILVLLIFSGFLLTGVTFFLS